MQEPVLEKTKERETCRGIIRLSGLQWENNAKRIHGEKYDYSRAVWGTGKTRVRVLCRKCGTEFRPLARAHVYNKTGCPKCAHDFVAEILRGRVFSAEHRRKLSEAGRKRKGWVRKKLDRIVKACPVCGSVFYVIPCRNDKIFCSRECAILGRRKQRYDRHGKNNTRWKGGITPLRQAIWKSDKYDTWRRIIFARDKRACQECGTKVGEFQVHHTPYEFSDILKDFRIKTMDDALACDVLWDKNNGRVMCIKCHRKTYKFKGNQHRK